MHPRTRLVDDGPRKLVLRERGGILELVSGSVVLLSSAALETERAFGRLASSRARTEPPRRILIGGLGFGATVRGVLDVSGPATEVVVAEKVGAVERLVRGELADLAGRPLDDPRVAIVIGDIGETLTRSEGDFDAVLLDVDNGPHWASFRTNARLYTPAGLAAAHRAIVPGGIFAVWSGYPADAFVAALRAAGFAPSIEPLRERGQVRARAYVGVRLPTSAPA
jgi:spermidine synthase